MTSKQNFDTYIEKGKQLLTDEKYDEAIALYTKALTIYPDNATIYRNLGFAQEKIGDTEGEVISYQKAIECDQQQPRWVYTTLGALLKEKERLEDVLNIYNIAREIFPDHEFFSSEIESIQETLKTTKTLEIAQKLVKEEKYDEAISIYQEAIKLYPQEASLYRELGVIQEQIGDFSGQRHSYQKSLQLKSQQPVWVYIILARLLRDNQQFDEAIAIYQQGIELYPDQYELYRERGVTQEKIGDIPGEIISYQKAIELNHQQPLWVYTTLANLLQNQEKWEEAIAIYEQTINLYPHDFWPYMGLGELYQKNKEYEKAIHYYQISINIANQNNIEPYLKIIQLYLDTQEFIQAKNQIEEAEKIFGEDNTLLSFSAELYMQLGELSEAYSIFDKISQETKDLPKWFYLRYIYCLFQLGKNEQINQLLTVIKEFNQDYFYEAQIFVENLGQTYYDNSQYHFNLETKLSNLEVLIKRNQLEEAKVIGEEIIAEGFSEQIPSSYRNLFNQPSLKSTLESEDLAEKQNITSISDLKIKKLTKSKPQRAALTIVSKNYISLARVLAESFLKYHPDAIFFLVLVDRIDGYFEPENEICEVIQLEEIPLPNRKVFPYWYTILELNTAVKPFALEYIFNKYESIEHLLYIDPDIQIFAELEKIWQELKHNSVVLTPHMRKPFNDNLHPTELNILQSGSYNLGFIGLTRSKQSLELLKWWQERLYLDCVVDIPRGLFTDQKWIDLVPSYFSETAIIREPSYNAAYWNIHEREIENNSQGDYVVEGDNLRFFHFSGYSPNNRNKLSKHQNRHNLRYMPIIKKLCDQYGDKLLQHGYNEANKWPYAFGVFGNNIKIAGSIIWVIRECIEKNISFPDLNEFPDEFCKYLFTPNPYFTGYEIPPIYVAILTKRPDVKNTFPQAWYHALDEGFISWLTGNGKKELDLEYLVDNYIQYVKEKNPVQKVLNIYEIREDIQNVYPQFWRTRENLISFQEWLYNSGIKEAGLSHQEIDLFTSSWCFHKILLFYYQRPDLQKIFCRLHESHVLDDFTNWLCQNVRELPNISYENIIWFNFIAKKEINLLLKINFIYNSYLKNICGDFSLFSIEKRSKFLDIKDKQILSEICDLSIHETLYPLIDHIKLISLENKINQKLISETKHQESLIDSNNLDDFIESLTFYSDISEQIRNAVFKQKKKLSQLLTPSTLSQEKQKPDDLLICVAGNFSAITGMGQSVRSMAKTLLAANFKYHSFDIPTTFIDESQPRNIANPWLMGWYYPTADLTITVMNADSFSFSQQILPDSYWTAKKNIGYWVWETDQLPPQWASSAIAYDEIWTPSQYSADAISKTIDKPVRVVPHVIDFEAIDEILSDLPEQTVLRQKFGLPEDGFFFGFFFDPKSYLERKNPNAVIRAFESAFPESKDVYLILKVNGSLSNYDFELLKSSVTNPRVIFLEESLCYSDVIKLMKCLDSYVSLHRGEGFGLTLAEAMAIGKPTIATGYSGNLQFMNSDNSLLVDYELIQTDRPYGSYRQGTIWAEPNIEQAAEFMLKLYNDQEFYAQISSLARQSVYEQLSPQKVALILKTHIDNLLV